MTEKRCTHCKQTKSVEMFYRNSSVSDGRMNQCIACERERRNAPPVPKRQRAVPGSGVVAPSPYARGYRWGAGA